MDWIESYDDLVEAMKSHRTVHFERRYFEKVETVYDYYCNRKEGFRFEDQDSPQDKEK